MPPSYKTQISTTLNICLQNLIYLSESQILMQSKV